MSETITTISPSTGNPVLERKGLSKTEIEPVVQRSVEAFKRWRQTTVHERLTIVEKALAVLKEKTDLLARELTEQMGRPIAYTSKEITTFLARAQYLLKISADVLADRPGDPEAGFKRYIKRAPVGPALIIFAWNVCISIFPVGVTRSRLTQYTVPISDTRQLPDSSSDVW